MIPITLDYKKSLPYIMQNDIDVLEDRISRCHNMIHEGGGQVGHRKEGAGCRAF